MYCPTTSRVMSSWIRGCVDGAKCLYSLHGLQFLFRPLQQIAGLWWRRGPFFRCLELIIPLKRFAGVHKNPKSTKIIR